MLATLKQNKSLVSMHQRPMEVFGQIFRAHPQQMWERIGEILATHQSYLSYELQTWLKGEIMWERDEDGEEGTLEGSEVDQISNDEKIEPLLMVVPPDLLWEWIDEDIDNRAWRIALIVPKALFRDKSRVCLAREILVRYGDREDVQHNLMANFSTGGWSGEASLHWAQKRDRLLKFRAGETNERVLNWINEYGAYLNSLIEQERIREEFERLA